MFQAYRPYIGAIPGEVPGSLKGAWVSWYFPNYEYGLEHYPPCNKKAMAIFLQLDIEMILVINIYLPPQQKMANITTWEELECYLENLLLQIPAYKLLM